MEQRARDVVWDVRHDLVLPVAGDVARVEAERIGLDERERRHPGELAAQPRGQPGVELDRGHRGSGRQQPAREHAEARPDLDDPVAGADLGGGHDLVEGDRVGQEVLAQALLRPQPLGTEQSPQLPRRWRNEMLRRQRAIRIRSHGAASHGKARFGIASREGSARSPAAKR